MSIEKIIADVQQKYRILEKKVNNPVVHDTCHVFSNETKIANIFTKLSSLPSLKVARKNNMAIFIGESSFLSLLPILAKHVDTILFIDIDPRVLAHILFMINIMKSASNRLEFVQLLRNPQKNPLLQKKVKMAGVRQISLDGSYNSVIPGTLELDTTLLTVLLNSSKVLLEGRHFLETNEQFNIAKQHVNRIQFHALELDFFENDLISFLGEKLFIHDVNVPIINVSNLYDYDNPPHALNALIDPSCKELWYASGKLYECLTSLLTRPEEALIMYSVMNASTEYNTLITDAASGLAEYKKRTQDYSGFINSRKIAKRYGEVLSPSNNKNVFFNTNLGSTTTYRLNALEDFLKIIFPDVQIAYTQATSKHYLIDMIIRSNRESAEKLLTIFKKYSIPHSHSPLNDFVIITLKEINHYEGVLVKMSQSERIRPQKANKCQV